MKNLSTIKELIAKYKDAILYLFFGVCTTIINMVVYYVLAHYANWGTMSATIAAWVAAVLGAYLTNRKWVFHSDAKGAKEIFSEIVSFFSCRVATGVLDWLIMLVFVDFLSFNDVVIKFAANVVVVLLNYVASKLVIFRKKDRKDTEK